MNTLAYSTNSLTTTPDDLAAIRGGGQRIRRPQVAKQRFSRTRAPKFDPSLATRNPGRVPNVAVKD